MEGMINIRLRPWLRRAITRFTAIVPAAIIAGIGGNAAAGKLLVLSQVPLFFNNLHIKIFLHPILDLHCCYYTHRVARAEGKNFMVAAPPSVFY